VRAKRRNPIAATLILAAIALGAERAATQERPTGQGFTFRSAAELINVTVTVTDEHGRFVPNLRATDFEVSENGVRQTISQFEAERVPVSLGIALDTSGSMVGNKIVAAQAALNRFLFDLLGPNDEVFLYRFDSRPDLVQGWTTDRQEVSRALGSVKPNGGTAIFDTVAEAVPMAQRGSQRKKAIVVISDGQDTSSRTPLDHVQQLIRETEVLVYAIGIDASGSPTRSYPRPSAPASSRPTPVPSPFPGQQRYTPPPSRPAPPSSSSTNRSSSRSGDRINVDSLRRLTDDSGGRTEMIVSEQDLEPATAGIADELSRQYFIGYTSTLPKDGKWHTIEVRVKDGNYTVRARRGFIAG
jgi:Ca-activated chloride channel family protein